MCKKWCVYVCSVLLTVATAVGQVFYPGKSPGKARVSERGGALLKNEVIQVQWTTGTSGLKLKEIKDLQSAQSVSVDRPAFRLQVDGQWINSTDFETVAGPRKSGRRANKRATRLGDRFNTYVVELRLQHKSGVQVLWQAELRDLSNYVRTNLVINSLKEVRLGEVVLLDVPVKDPAIVGDVNGSPLFDGALFYGFENPGSQAKVNEGVASFSYNRNTTLKQGQSYTCAAVIGVIPEPSQQRRAFQYYLERERAAAFRQYLHYNSWFDLNIYNGRGNRMDSHEVEAVIKAIGDELVKKRGVKFDGFVMDDGWDSHKKVWDFHDGFPNGFKEIADLASQYGAGIGLWMSPWGGYEAEKQARLVHGKAAGFETNRNGFSMAGPNYRRHFENTCKRMITQFKANHFKFDGMGGGTFSSGANEFADDIASIVEMVDELRKLNPNVWINATVGTWPSPYWVWHADSIWRQEKDTGFMGVGNKREQWITYRDWATYHRIVKRGPLYPLNSIMFHGVVIGPRHHPKEMPNLESSVQNEVRAAFGCGSGLQELYITPRLLTPAMWDDIAESANWSRRNQHILMDTHWVGGDPGQLEPYGWASWSPRGAIVCVRNPNEQPAEIVLEAGEVFELPANAPKSYAMRAVYQDQRVKGVTLVKGKNVKLKLQPFEVLTFQVGGR